jgi:hypothetical protein
VRTEVEHFVSCVHDGTTPRSHRESGRRVVRVLEALQSSLDASRRDGLACSAALSCPGCPVVVVWLGVEPATVVDHA